MYNTQSNKNVNLIVVVVILVIAGLCWLIFAWFDTAGFQKPVAYPLDQICQASNDMVITSGKIQYPPSITLNDNKEIMIFLVSDNGTSVEFYIPQSKLDITKVGTTFNPYETYIKTGSGPKSEGDLITVTGRLFKDNDGCSIRVNKIQ
jgi:hypothetical protein